MVAQLRAARNADLRDFPIHYKPGSGRTVIACGVSDLPDGRTAHKYVDRRRHFQHNRNAIAWAVAVVKRLREMGVERLLVVDTFTGTEYRATLAALQEHGYQDRLDTDLQYFLPLKFWDVRHPILEAETPTPSPQLALFEV